MIPTRAKAPKALLFDLGGVLIDIQFSLCFESWAESTGQTPAAIKAAFAFDDAYAAHECAAITGEQYYRHVCARIGVDMPFAAFKAGWNAIYKGVIPETFELLQSLSGSMDLFAFTNSNLMHRQAWTTMFEPQLSLFDRIFCSSQIKLRKPDAAAFEKILHEVNLNKDEIIFIDDLEENIRGAERIGIRSVLFRDPQKSVTEIKRLAQGLA